VKHEIKKVSKILDELITFCFLHGTNNMDISLENTKEHFKIKLVSDNIDCSDARVQKLNDLLNEPRHQEMEEHYWELTGESDHDTELCLVGMMVDKAIVEFNGSSLSIVLYRNK